ncbi:hypothetical protein MRX96_032315 [Rhipicephalus microplus]|uniref:BCL11 transcription factor A-like n=1 Tax=Rhipicephalus microplus TaxID=6941 RepID=UPI003F6D7035
MFLSAIPSTSFSDHVPGAVQSTLREFDDSGPPTSETRVDHQPIESQPETPATDKMYKCHVCSLEFQQWVELRAHRQIHNAEKPYKCNSCPYRAAEKSDLMTHVCTGEKPFMCKHCLYRFKKRCQLESHMRTHTGEKPFKCEHCSYKCARKSMLDSHMLTHWQEALHV